MTIYPLGKIFLDGYYCGQCNGLIQHNQIHITKTRIVCPYCKSWQKKDKKTRETVFKPQMLRNVTDYRDDTTKFLVKGEPK